MSVLLVFLAATAGRRGGSRGSGGRSRSGSAGGSGFAYATNRGGVRLRGRGLSAGSGRSRRGGSSGSGTFFTGLLVLVFFVAFLLDALAFLGLVFAEELVELLEDFFGEILLIAGFLALAGLLSGSATASLLRAAAAATAGLLGSTLLALLADAEELLSGLSYLRANALEVALLALLVGLLQLALVTGEGRGLDALDQLLLELLSTALTAFGGDSGRVARTSNGLTATESSGGAASGVTATSLAHATEVVLIRVESADCRHLMHSLFRSLGLSGPIIAFHQVGGELRCFIIVNLLNMLLTVMAKN